MNKLSVVVTVHNNQDIIKDCLKSVSFADEIIVVDNESTDDTAKIAKKFGAVVFAHKNNPKQLNESKNFGFSKAKYEWILSLDSDERIEQELKDEIKFILSKDNIPFNGYKIPRHNIIFGKIIRHGLWYPDHQLRLFRNGQGEFPNKHNHELLQIKGEAGVLKGHIKHFNYQTISQYIQKIDKQYTENEMETYIEQKRKIQWYDALRFPAQDFMSNYFVRQAYKDGLHGLVLSLLQAFYMFIVFAKIWEKQGFKEHEIDLEQAKSESEHVFRQLKFWYYNEKQKNTKGVEKFIYKLKSKL